MSKKLLPFMMGNSASASEQEDNVVAIAIIDETYPNAGWDDVTSQDWADFRALYPNRKFIIMQPEYTGLQPTSASQASEQFIQTPSNFDAELTDPDAPTYFIANTTTLGESGYPQLPKLQVQTKANLDLVPIKDPRQVYEVISDPNPGFNNTYTWSKTDFGTGPKWVATSIDRTKYSNRIPRDFGNSLRQTSWKSIINTYCFNMDAVDGFSLKYKDFLIYIDNSTSMYHKDVVISYLEFIRNIVGRGGTVKVINGLDENWVKPFLDPNFTGSRIISSYDQESLNWGSFPFADADYSITTQSYFGALKVTSGSDRLTNWDGMSQSDSRRINPTFNFNKGDKVRFNHTYSSGGIGLDYNDANSETMVIKVNNFTGDFGKLTQGGNVAYSNWPKGQGVNWGTSSAPSSNFDDWVDTDSDGYQDFQYQEIHWHTGVSQVNTGTYYYQGFNISSLTAQIILS